MCMSMARSKTPRFRPNTLAKRSRLTIFPASVRSTCSTSNSAVVRLTGSPDRATVLPVGSKLKADYLVDFFAFSGEHDDVHLRLGPQLAQELKTIELRHHNVQQDDVILGGESGPKPARAICALCDRITFLGKKAYHHIAEFLVVINDEHRRH